MRTDLVKYILKNIINRFTRSFLTVLSILIGIMAVYTLVSFGQGLSQYVTDMGNEVGADKLIVQPKGAGVPGSTGISLTENDLDTIKKVVGVSEASALAMQQAEVSLDEDKRGKWVFIVGMPTDAKEQRLVDEAFGGYGILKGRALKKGDTNKVLLGYNYQFENKLFPEALKLGDKIFIIGEKFEIIGFYEEIGNTGDDSNVYMTNERVETLFDVEDQFAMIFIRAQPDTEPSKLADKIEEELRDERDEEEDKETFTVETYEELLETFGVVLNILNSILVLIAMISVFVAAVNIMNTMYTAVLERTKEIGIMKAIGARNRYILMVFFFESGTLGIIGGIMGVIFGFGLAKLGGAIAASAGYALLKPAFPWWLTFGCLLFSFLIGAGSGFFPALRASKQKPVDALRYE